MTPSKHNDLISVEQVEGLAGGCVVGADGGEWVSGQWVSAGGISNNLRGNIKGKRQPRIHLWWESHLSATRGHRGRVLHTIFVSAMRRHGGHVI